MQINQLAKAGANFEIIPEATHNTLIATLNPNPTLNSHTMTLWCKHRPRGICVVWFALKPRMGACS